MLQISRHQFETFARNQSRIFFDQLNIKLRAYIKKEYPDSTDSEIALRADQILNFVDRWDLDTEKQITELAFILTAFPNDFERDEQFEWLIQILTRDIESQKKIEQIQSIINIG